MNETIDVAEGKTLKLNNILCRLLDSTDNDAIAKTMTMIDSYMKIKGLEPYGPLIIKTEVVMEGTREAVRNSIIVQLKSPPNYVDLPYDFKPLVRMENCLMARYRGPFAGLQMAGMKIQVYSFENGITLSGESYTVMIEQNEGGILADVFSAVM